VNLSLHMAGQTIDIFIEDRISGAEAFLGSIFRHFKGTDLGNVTLPAAKPNCRVIRILDEASASPQRGHEGLLAGEEVSRISADASWQHAPVETIGCFCLGGELLFHRKSLDGLIRLPPPDDSGLGPLYRLLWIYMAQVLGERRRCFVHAAGIAKERRGYLFFGDSGKGKSTLASGLKSGIVFSDDAPILHFKAKIPLLYPSPFTQISTATGPDGAHHRPVDVCGIYFLDQSPMAKVERIRRKTSLPLIIQGGIHAFEFLSPQARLHLFDLFFGVCETTRCFRLKLPKKHELWSLIDR
jgi:hypothetical protein